MRTYTKAQLALRNGQDKEETWVAYQGKIYDVTSLADFEETASITSTGRVKI